MNFDRPAQAGASLNKAEAVSRYIRERILSLEFAPGSFIDKSEICSVLGVSRQPVTAALTELSREGLVEILPQRGSYVTRLDRHFMKEKIAVRCALEGAIAASNAAAPSAELIGDLREIIGRQRAALSRRDVQAFEAQDEAFHRRAARDFATPNMMADIDAGLMCLKRMFSVLPPDFARLNDVPRLHDAMVDAIERGDQAQSALLFIQHGQGFSAMIDRLHGDHPEVFMTGT